MTGCSLIPGIVLYIAYCWYMQYVNTLLNPGVHQHVLSCFSGTYYYSTSESCSLFSFIGVTSFLALYRSHPFQPRANERGFVDQLMPPPAKSA
jgi:hypothetical protein